MKNKILIVEDEARLSEVLCDLFRSKGDLPTAASDGAEALKWAEEESFDAVLLDIMMPELDGFSVCRALRKKSDVPVIFLTALSDEDDKLKGFELGADDYVTKPYSLTVLYAKTSALIKRSRGNMLEGNVLSAGSIAVSLFARRVTVSGSVINLTPKEYDLLVCLIRNKNIVLSREQIIIKCWGYDYEGDIRAVDTHIKRLRVKLGDSADMIKTIVKAGYMLEVCNEI